MNRRAFTGRTMSTILVSFFGVIIAVNFTMAWFAVCGFGGVVVDNSYVASQKFNGWLKEAQVEDGMGWSARVSRDAGGHLIVQLHGVPRGAKVVAALRRPIGPPEDLTLDMIETGPNLYLAPDIEPGRWIVRLEVEAAGRRWSHETNIS
ncbi:FixH family protein [Qipengyuania sp.]|uniref:FixH family protein n=1 Tax=Qipengyuania sp. TaxID=2004515 RepID=UPI0035C7FD95